MRTVVLAAFLLAAAGGAARAGPPSDLVRGFYAPVGYEPDPALRNLFVDPARKVFGANDRVVAQGDTCIDWVPSIDAQDMDQAEVDRSLKLDEKVDGDGATVTATFMLFANQPDSRRQIVWSLRKVGETWKVADIASLTSDWRLSALDCAAP